MDVTLEAGVLRNLLRLGKDAVVTAALDDAPLMERQAAKGAFAYTAAVGRDGEFDLAYCGDAARRLVDGMVVALVGQVVNRVHLGRGKRLAGGVLHDVEAVVFIRLHQGFAAKGVQVLVLNPKAFCVFQAVCAKRLPARQDYVLGQGAKLLSAISSTGDPGDLVDGKPTVERLGNLDDGMFAHAIANHVGAAVEQDGALELVGPVVVVRQAPQGRLHAAQDDGRVLVGAADQVAVDDGCVVGAQAHLSAG